MGDAFDRLTTTILILNALTGGTLLPVVALLLIVLAVSGICWMVSRSRPSVEEMADPEFNPDLDRWESTWRDQRKGDDRG